MIMKTFKLNTLAAALTLVGFVSACDRNTAQRDAYVPPQPPPIERSTTAEGITNPGALESLQEDPYASNTRTSGGTVDIDHEETVQFSGTELTDASEEKLEDLADALDKDKPVAVTVAIQESGVDVSGANSANPDIRAEQDASLSDRADPNGTAGELDNGAEFAQRVDRVREFLQEQGVKVVHWQFEGTTQSEATTQTQAMNQQQDVQQIRIVIADSIDAEKFGAL
jgi:hypothetical protein